MTTPLLDRPRTVVPDLDGDVTRRGFLTGAGATLLLAGCGADQIVAPEAAPSGDGAFPVRIEHLFGTAEIPAEPRGGS